MCCYISRVRLIGAHTEYFVLYGPGVPSLRSL